LDSFDELGGSLLNLLNLDPIAIFVIICVANFISITAIISLPFFDFSSNSIFKAYKERQKTALEKIAVEKTCCSSIWDYMTLYLQVPLHLIVFFTMSVGLFSFPLNSSSLLLNDTRKARYIILLTQGIVIPVVAGVLQFDIQDIKGNLFPVKLSVFPKYKYHVITCLFLEFNNSFYWGHWEYHN
jgi:hypothetical protein